MDHLRWPSIRQFLARKNLLLFRVDELKAARPLVVTARPQEQ
jgi:hypothetical protein